MTGYSRSYHLSVSHFIKYFFFSRIGIQNQSIGIREKLHSQPIKALVFTRYVCPCVCLDIIILVLLVTKNGNLTDGQFGDILTFLLGIMLHLSTGEFPAGWKQALTL